MNPAIATPGTTQQSPAIKFRNHFDILAEDNSEDNSASSMSNNSNVDTRPASDVKASLDPHERNPHSTTVQLTLIQICFPPWAPHKKTHASSLRRHTSKGWKQLNWASSHQSQTQSARMWSSFRKQWAMRQWTSQSNAKPVDSHTLWTPPCDSGRDTQKTASTPNQQACQLHLSLPPEKREVTRQQ